MKSTSATMVACASAVLMSLVNAGNMGGQLSFMKRSLRMRGNMDGNDHLVEMPKVEPFDAPFNINPKRCVTGYWHVGCKHDVQVKNRRTYKDLVEKVDREPMTVEVCWNFCKNVSGAQFFGLERGDQCYCTPNFNDDKDYADEMCDQICEGNPGQMCGGSQRLQDIYEMHDCDNLPPMPCKKSPGLIKHAKAFDSTYYKNVKVPCKNAIKGPLDTVQQSLCQVECEEGYHLLSNDLKCVERGDRLNYVWGGLQGSAYCTPIECGEPAPLGFAKYPKISVFYPNPVTYSCDIGYSLNISDPGNTQQDVKCLNTAKFDKVETCKPVGCGKCPQGGKYPNGLWREKGTRVYQDICNFDCQEGYTLNMMADGTKEFKIACLYSGEFQEPPTCLPVKCGPSPKVLFAGVADPAKNGFEFVFPEEVPYSCAKGYTLDGFPNTDQKFSLSCKANAKFSDPPVCKPVLNGNPPYGANADYADRPYVYGEGATYTCRTGYTFTGKVGEAFTRTLFAGADGNWQGAPPVCKPVECGASPSVGKSKINGSAPAMVTFASAPLQYLCEPGYSTVVSDNIWEPIQNTFLVSCLSTGEFSKKACVNIDDCLIRNCGNHGKCKDLPSPTGKPLDDYTCDCESGYEITLHDSIIRIGAQRKLCTNINDCPVPLEDGCGGRNFKGLRRGLCVDLINKYQCDCGAGYNMNGSPNETCSPVPCGAVKGIEHTDCLPDVVGKSVDYDTEPWIFSCKPGYSLDGEAKGPKNLNMSCTSNGEFSAGATCKPVSCGAPKMVGSADMAPEKAELVFGEHVIYACDEGYALKGDPKGLRKFQVDCLESGDLSSPDDSPGGKAAIEVPKADPAGQPKGAASNTTTTTPMSCLPVICGTVPVQEFASWNETKVYVYPQASQIDCNEGYSIDGSAVPDKDDYKAWCQSSGEFKITKKCQIIECKVLPEVPHSSHDPAGPYFYKESVTYQMEPGYHINRPGVGRINGSFTCHCGADGKFNGTCAGEIKSVPIDCGTAPEVAHATVTGTTIYTGKLTANADTGFSLDGTPNGQTEFTFFCKDDGRFSARQEFQPIECGLCAEYANVDKVGYKPADHTVALLAGKFNSSAMKFGKRLYRAFYNDEVDYVCEEGFRAASGAGAIALPVFPVVPEQQIEFKVTCAATGDFKMQVDLAKDTSCVHITCDVTEVGASVKRIPLLPKGMARLQYKETQNFVCKPGYSTDGTPSGATAFTEACSASGQLSAVNDCKDIDWCLVSKCGTNGTCVDGKLAYACECKPGYQVSFVDGSWQTCTEILECETQNGFGACSVGGGKCNEKILGYSCTCTSGYENLPNDKGFDSCSAVLCLAAPIIDNARAGKAGQKMSYPQETVYTCDTGYTIDGNAGGTNAFTVGCGADAALKGVTSCKPVKCPAAVAVNNSRIQGDKESSYGLSVAYLCDMGYTTTGVARASATFSVSCLANGQLSAAGSCAAVKCGAPPNVAQADILKGPKAEPAFPDKLEYGCAKGYTTDGRADGPTTFEVSCVATGRFEGVETCQAVKCGRFEGVKHGQSPALEYSFPAMLSVVCDAGHSIDADPRGESTFLVRCGADGKYKNVKECKPVTCGPPTPTPRCTTTSDAKVFKEIAEYTCTAGYSTNGKIKGPVVFRKQCEASGSFGRASPSDCADIDFCEDSPCTANGVCTDVGAGVPFPGYNCTCHEGFEIKPNADGSDKCAADDCFGAPCGAGGTCMDLSKLGGAAGTYACECQDGYSLADGEKGQTCQRNVCGLLPKVNHTDKLDDDQFYNVRTWKGGEPDEDPFTGRFILNSFDTATFYCAAGYSTDGRTTPEGKSFSVDCLPSGLFSRAVKKELECQPILCDFPFLPSIQFASVINKGEKFAFGDDANFQCQAGYSLDGKSGGPNTFSVMCQANGRFSSTLKKCKPTTCEVPEAENAVASKGMISYGEQVQYSCKTGFGVDGLAGAAGTTIMGTCGEAGDSCKAIIYEHGDFTGWAVSFETGSYDSKPMTSRGAKNDAVSALKVFGHPDCRVELFGGGDFDGWKASYGPGEYPSSPLVKGGAKDDAVSSLKVLPPPTECQAILYQHGDYEGWSATFSEGEYDLGAMAKGGAKNNQGSSLKVMGPAAGCKVELYENDGFEGFKFTYGPGEYDYREFVLGVHDKVSSLKVIASSSRIAFPGRENYFNGCEPVQCGSASAQPAAKFMPPRDIEAVVGCSKREGPKDTTAKENSRLHARCCSKDGNTCKTSDIGCLRGTFMEAQEHCARAGMRLCSVSELKSNICCSTGCGHDSYLIWTSQIAGSPIPADWLGQKVFITSPRNQQLQDNSGSTGFAITKTDKEKWVITDAGDGKFFITSNLNQQLQDDHGTPKMSKSSASWEKWTFSDAGDGKVFITSHRNEQIKDYEGKATMTRLKDNLGMWTLSRAASFLQSEKTSMGSGLVRATPDFANKECCVSGDCNQGSQWGSYVSFNACQQECADDATCVAFEYGKYPDRCKKDADDCKCYLAVACLDQKTHASYNVYLKGMTKKNVSLTFGDVAKYQCGAGKSLGGIMGGDLEYEVTCGADGKLSGGILGPMGVAAPGGPPLAGGMCEDVRLSVKGEVTDASDARMKLEEVRVTFTDRVSGKTAASVYTDKAGVYSARVEGGEYIIVAEKMDYVSNEKGPISMTTDLRPGQSADISLAKPLGPDGWKVVLNWNDLQDLDAHTFFGCDLSQHVSFRERIGNSERAGGLRVTLDRDDADGYGPESTTIMNAGNCKEMGCCLLKYKVNLKLKDGTIAKSGATVSLYQGAGRVQKFTVPACLPEKGPDESWWTVFTIDVTSGQNKFYEGDRLRAPYVKATSMGTKSWDLSMDVARWSTVETPETSLPAFITGLNFADKTKLHMLESAKFYNVKGGRGEVECQDVSWAGVIEKEQMALCPAGYYLNGLYRTGSKVDAKEGIDQLQQARCCRAKGGSNAWGVCSDQSMVGIGWSECKDISGQACLLVGLQAKLEAGAAPPPPTEYTGPKALHGQTGTGIFLGGEYIELGFRTNSLIGKMGADGSPPGEFYKRAVSSGVGMLADSKGFKNDPSMQLVIDYFLPGSPEESFWAGYKVGSSPTLCNNCGNKVEDTSAGGATASSRTTALVGGNLQVLQDITLGVSDKFFKNTITLKNVGGSTLTSVRFMRSHDPDNTVDRSGSYQTEQKLEAVFGTDGYAAVSAMSQAFDGYYTNSGGKRAIVMYYSDDKRAKASFGTGGLRPNDIYDPRVYDAPAGRFQTISADAYISICFDVGSLAPGQETTMTYYTALDSRPISEVVAEVIKAASPVLSLTKMKCCAVEPAGLWEGEPTCPA